MSLRMLPLGVGVALILGVFLLACGTGDAPPGGIVLLPEYAHTSEQGIDSSVGRIWKANGITIRYDIGKMAGNHVEQVRTRSPQAYYQAQEVNGRKVTIAIEHQRHVVMTVDGNANFSADVTSYQELSDVILTVMTYPIPRGER